MTVEGGGAGRSGVMPAVGIRLSDEEFLTARDATPAYMHLAAAVIIRAMKDAQGRDEELAKEARDWLEEVGREWGEVLSRHLQF